SPDHGSAATQLATTDDLIRFENRHCQTCTAGRWSRWVGRTHTTDQWITRNQFDGLSGKDGKFKASKSKLRDVIDMGIDFGSIVVHTVSPEERDNNGLAKQVKEVLRARS
ncbi:hypothetical protein, partial [Sheuella amnicola]|uniref:hypothetical protein n=1 Tax=Sheuella amnicola TaxID=2707330 RepID=UPI00194130D7